MIESFIGPMGGIDTHLSYEQLKSFRKQDATRFRQLPAGVVTGPLNAGYLDLARDWHRVRNLTASTLKFTVTSPYMLARTLLNQHYKDVKALTFALADLLAEQIASIDAPVVQIDEAHLTGHPEDGAWAHEPSWRPFPENGACICVSATTAVRASKAASGKTCFRFSTN